MRTSKPTKKPAMPRRELTETTDAPDAAKTNGTAAPVKKTASRKKVDKPFEVPADVQNDVQNDVQAEQAEPSTEPTLSDGTVVAEHPGETPSEPSEQSEPVVVSADPADIVPDTIIPESVDAIAPAELTAKAGKKGKGSSASSASSAATGLVPSDTAATGLVPSDTAGTGAIFALNQAEGRVNSILTAIPKMTDAELEEGLRACGQIERAAFVIRGAILAEKKKRAARLTGGRGKKAGTGDQGPGVGEIAREMARETGMHAATLETDARIYEAFKYDLTTTVARGDGSGVDLEAAPATLPREYYAIALTAGDEAKQKEAIEIAHNKFEAGGYSTKKFEQDVRALRGEAPAAAVEDLYHLTHISLDKTSRAALQKLSEAWKVDQQEAVRRALIACSKAVDLKESEPDVPSSEPATESA